VRAGIAIAALNLVALVLHFSVDTFVVRRLAWDHAYVRDFVSFVVVSITILVVAIPEGLPVAVMLSLAYSVKVRRPLHRLRFHDGAQALPNRGNPRPPSAKISAPSIFGKGGWNPLPPPLNTAMVLGLTRHAFSLL